MRTSIALFSLATAAAAVAACSSSDVAPNSTSTPPSTSIGADGGAAHHDGGGGSVVDVDGGGVNYASYTSLTDDYAGFVDYLSGPAYSAFHGDDGSNKPTIYDRNNGGTYCFGDCMKPPVDWSGFAGQVLFAQSGGPGVTRARFSWARSEGHGGTQFAHLYLLMPKNQPDANDSDSWYTSLVDPGVDVAAWKDVSGGAQLAEPLAIGRGKITWSNNGIIAFRNGLIGAVGSGNSSDDFPFVKLDAGKVPTDVAVTNNDEFALVTVWDTTACKGQIAVIALQQRDGYLFALPNEGFFAGMKLLGYVDLPIAAPTRINASNDFGLYMSFSSKDAESELATQAGRDKWMSSSDVQHTAAKAGVALIASRDENKVVVLDLEPLFQYYRSMYMTTQANYDRTTNVGPAADQWPFAFSFASESMPIVVEVLDVEKPASVVVGYPIGDRGFTDIDFAKKAYVATVDGNLTAYDLGGLSVVGPATKLQPLASMTTCKNPTRVFYSAAGASRDGLVFACRGDRAIQFIDGGGAKVRTLEDSRLADPVAVSVGDARGASVITVADFAGKKVVNYLNGPVNAWGDKIFGGVGADGLAEFEFTGALSLSGNAFSVSAAEVP